MRTLEIVMRIVCFLVGVMLASGGSVRVSDGRGREGLANALLVLVWLGAALALLVLPWALPLRN